MKEKAEKSVLTVLAITAVIMIAAALMPGEAFAAKTPGKATLPEISERLSLSDPQREAAAPSGLIYREGLLPFVELVALSRRLCQIVKVGNLLSVLGSVFGALLGFYLTFVGRSDALSPVMLMIYLLLWTAPMLPLLMGSDKI